MPTTSRTQIARSKAPAHKSTEPRAIRGKVGQWLGLPVSVILNGWVCNPFVCWKDEKLHVIHVPACYRDAVFREMGMTWSWSKHAALRYLMDAVLLSPKPNLWHHGMVSIGEVSGGKVVSITEHHSMRGKRVENPWEGSHEIIADRAG